MKTLFNFLVGSLMVLSSIAQTTGTVTINIRGNQTQQVIVDGKTYTVYPSNNDNNNYGNNTPITITDLYTGQHTLQIVRSDDYNNNTDNSNVSYFNLRSGYNLQITINGNGTIQQRETRVGANTGNYGYRTPMADADFNNLYRSINSQWRNSTRLNLLNNTFANTNNYFTTAQARQLIQLISSQSSRLSLAKAAYKNITDPSNFSQLYSLFTNQAYRDELIAYVDNYNINNNSSVATSSARFNSIYRTAKRQYTTSSRVTYLSDIFSNTNNHFTVAQVRQLIQLVPDESNRLYLGKVSYRSITDPANFSQITQLLNSQVSRDELTTYVNTYNGTTSNAGSIGTPMKSNDFNSLYQDVQRRFGLGAKMSALKDVFNNSSNHFTVAQAKQLIQLVSSESNRLELAKASYNNIVDPSNFNQMYDVLSSQSSRNELEAYVRNNYNYQNGTTYNNYRSPMSDASFNAIYNDISSRWGFGAKMSALTDVFNNESNYFTVAQAKRLILLVSDEDNRLQLAKSSYNNITDTQNFSLMYDVLGTQASRDELTAYVNSYPNK